ncbi:MAG: hypothetical protein QOG82_75 [Actinomycetota bacterium]|jgi:signal transduction histidine kinase/chemotaxis response regulator CheB|nr:hypothetical protein [Actinomycetota bacterium]
MNRVRTVDEPAFDVVAVLGSAGGVDALTTILRSLPPDFPASVVVLQHLSDQGRALASILRRRIRLPVGWAAEGQKLAPGEVLLCPPASAMVVLPDGTVSIVGSMRPQDRPGDVLLESLSETHGPRTMAVILAGSGRDGAAGARAVKAAGGTVVAQGEATATAAVAAGAVDLVLALDEIGPLLVDVVGNGAPAPAASSDEAAAHDRVFVGGSEAATFLRSVDWSATPVGPVGAWPASLAAVVRTMLDNPLPVIVHWGPDLVVLPNDASRRLLGADFARVVGRPLREAWPDAWATNGPAHLDVLESGRPRVVEDAPFTVNRREVFLTSALTALRGDQGGLAGTMSTAVDTTDHVLGRRQAAVVHRLEADAVGAATVAEAAERAVAALESDPGLVPFALVYLLDGTRSRAQLTASTGLPPGTSAAPRTVALADDDIVWPLHTVARFGTAAVVDDLNDRLPGLRAGPYPEPPPGALALALRLTADERPAGVVVLGLSARRPLDAGYRAFLDQVAASLAAGLSDARRRQQERGRQEASADVDRAKTEFFANVSHEFRTPLTLLLGPLEAALAHRDSLPPGVGDDLDLAHRGALRLLRMVQSLLDFSQVEVGRRRGSFEATDLSTLTRELVGVFASAAEAAGLRLVVDCPPLPEPVWVDRVMWERIVANLLSNALKFTMRGQVSVTLRLLPSHAELVVADTGVGIPESEVAHVFERFHRVEGVAARTREGTGIGLSLVDDLVRLHHGRVRVRSRPGEGSTFTVWVPRGRRADAPGPGLAPAAAADTAADTRPDRLDLARSHADEALGWSADAPTDYGRPDREPVATIPWGRVLVVDDNPDLRTYLRRLLGRHWLVDVAADGVEARARLASASLPDLVVADVMMPEVDGLTLLQEIRDDPRLRDLPVILLSARAGDDATVAGLQAGADDYIVKPFSARELVARVGAQLELAQLRRQRDQAVRVGDDRLELALQASGFVAFEWDRVTNRLTFLGGDGHALFGVTGDDIAALVDVVHEDDLDVHLASLNHTLADGDPLVGEYRIRHPESGVRWIRSVAHRLPDDPRRLFGVAMDVTDRRTADESLAAATDRLRADVAAMVRFQELTNRLAPAAPVAPAAAASDLDALLEDVLDAAVELEGADRGTVCLYDPDTGDLEVVAHRPTAAGADAGAGAAGGTGANDAAYRVLQPDSVGTQSIPLVDRHGRPLGVLTTHTRHPRPRSDLELRLAELYLRQATAVVAVVGVTRGTASDAGAGPGAAAEETTEETADGVE